MGRIPEKLIKKIENNIEKIGTELRAFPGDADGNYMKNKEKALPIGHIFSWTQSFFTGMALWAYADTHDVKFLDWTMQFKKSYSDKIELTPMETMHDLGFLYSPYAVMIYSITGNEEFKKMGIKAADALAMRFNPKGRYIRAWGRMDDVIPEYVDAELAKDHFFTESKGLAIVDCMMNLPLLFWASKVTGHPYYKRIAIEHANTTMNHFIRNDYSVMHAYRFSEETGEAAGEANYCGYSCGSYWARGTAWAIYGFAIAYNYTKKTEYMDMSIALLDQFMRQCNGKIPVWDFRLPKSEEQSVDTSAAAIVLCAIIEIEKHKTNPHLQGYKKELRKNLEEYINYDENVMGILREQNGRHTYTSFGDYYIIEAYMREASDIEVW